MAAPQAPAVYILYENADWLAAYREAVGYSGVSNVVEWNLNEISPYLGSDPPEGVYLNRMSASYAQRGHHGVLHRARATVHWLEAYGRQVINGQKAMSLELSKLAQYSSLRASGLLVPKTVPIFDQADFNAKKPLLLNLTYPVVAKPNCGGKGVGVHRFEDFEHLRKFLKTYKFDRAAADPILLVQEYIQSKEPFIRRLEFVGDECIYALRVTNTEGFELCPADACSTTPTPTTPNKQALFAIDTEFDQEAYNDLLEKLRHFKRVNQVDVCAFECIETAKGDIFVYDVNVNTNYNSNAEQVANAVPGRKRLGQFVGKHFEAAYPE